MEFTNHAAVIVSDNGDGRLRAQWMFADGRTGTDHVVGYAEIRRHMRALGADTVEIIRK